MHLAHCDCIVYRLSRKKALSHISIAPRLLYHLPTYSQASFLISNSGSTYGVAIFLTSCFWLCFLASLPTAHSFMTSLWPQTSYQSTDYSHRQSYPTIVSTSAYLEWLIFWLPVWREGLINLSHFFLLRKKFKYLSKRWIHLSVFICFMSEVFLPEVSLLTNPCISENKVWYLIRIFSSSSMCAVTFHWYLKRL